MKNLQKIIANYLLSVDKKDLPELLQGILTPHEIEAIATRFEIVKQLYQKKPQHKIAADLNIGIATVTRGSRVYQMSIFQKMFAKKND